jgi:hypothetical protein
MTMHFEELWEKCENLHKENISQDSVAMILHEVSMKLDLYKLMDTKEEVSSDEKEKIKSRLLGEILLALTKLSLKDNVNVFEALNLAFQYHGIVYYNNKHAGT